MNIWVPSPSFSSSFHSTAFIRSASGLVLLVLWQALIYLLRGVQLSWQTKYSPCIVLDKLNFSVSSQHLEPPCLVVRLLRIIIYSLHTASNVVKGDGFQRAFQQVRRAFHSFFLNHLSELDPKLMKGNIPAAFCITAPCFEREMGEDEVQPLWTQPGHRAVPLREFGAPLLFLAPGAAFHRALLFLFLHLKHIVLISCCALSSHPSPDNDLRTTGNLSFFKFPSPLNHSGVLCVLTQILPEYLIYCSL